MGQGVGRVSQALLAARQQGRCTVASGGMKWGWGMGISRMGFACERRSAAHWVQGWKAGLDGGWQASHHTADMETITGFRLLSRSVLLTPGKKAAAPVAAGNQAAAIALKSLDPMSWGGSVGRWKGWVGENQWAAASQPLVVRRQSCPGTSSTCAAASNSAPFAHLELCLAGDVTRVQAGCLGGRGAALEACLRCRPPCACCRRWPTATCVVTQAGAAARQV